MNHEYKRRYDPELGKYVKRHVFGEGIFSDTFKNLSGKLFKNTMKDVVKTGLQKGTQKVIENAAIGIGDYGAKKAGNQILQMLSKNKPIGINNNQTSIHQRRDLTKTEINNRINRILSGGRL